MILRKVAFSWILALFGLIIFDIVSGHVHIEGAPYLVQLPARPFVFHLVGVPIEVGFLGISFALLAALPTSLLALFVLRNEPYARRIVKLFPQLFTGMVVLAILFRGLGEEVRLPAANYFGFRCGCAPPTAAADIQDALHGLSPGMTRADIVKVAHGAMEECACADINHWPNEGHCTFYFFDHVGWDSPGILSSLVCRPVCNRRPRVLTTSVRVNFIVNEGKLTDVIDRLEPVYNSSDVGSCPM